MVSEIVGAVKSFLDLIKVWLIGKKKKQTSDSIIDQINIRLLSKALVKRPISVDCFFIVMIHNGGGPVRPDGFVFWSIIDGAHNEIMMPMFDQKNYLLVNMEMEFLLLAKRIYEQKGVGIRVDQMEKSSLRTSFEYERLKYIRFLYLKQDKRGMWFLMVGTTASDESLGSVQAEGEIFIAFNSVKNIIRDY